MTSRGSDRPLYSALLREYMADNAIGEQALADQLGVSRSAISNTRNGRGYPKVIENLHLALPAETAQKIAQAWDLHRTPNANSIVEESESDEMLWKKAKRRDLEGTWHALWQTVVDGQVNFNHETIESSWVRPLVLRVGNTEVSGDNPKGGYLWSADLRFADNEFLLGNYFPQTVAVQSKGTMFAVLHRHGRHLNGLWTGCNYDLDLACGHFVFARNYDELNDLMSKQIASGPMTAVENFGKMDLNNN